MVGINLFTLINRDKQSITKNKPNALAKNIDLFTLSSYIVKEMGLSLSIILAEILICKEVKIRLELP